VKVGRTPVCGTTNFGAGAAGAAAAGGATGVGALAAGATGAAGFASSGGAATGGRTAGGGTAEGCCLLMMALNTSPGFEIWERSILVLIPSSRGRLGRDDLAEAWASLAPRRRARTFSASCSSTELEWVFFSVTPTSVKVSRMTLLLTSSSLARSLIRILLIRPFFPPTVPLSLHSNPTVSAFKYAHSRLAKAREVRTYSSFLSLASAGAGSSPGSTATGTSAVSSLAASAASSASGEAAAGSAVAS
jgi:hypothetical protein